MLTKTEELVDLYEAVKNQQFVAVDTEFMRERSYWPHLCLIQIGYEDKAVAIDPLAQGIDLAPFFRILDDPSILKVFHAARQDVEIFYHLTGRVPAPLFDTQIAAMVCGFGESVGYDRLVRDLAGGHIDKARQLTDWARRPLKDNQINYALNDVTFLQDIYRKLRDRLHQNGRESWLDEEMRVLTAPETYALDPDEAWKRLKLKSRNKTYLAVLIALARWRELRAQDKNMPRNHVLKDEAIQELAGERPHRAEELMHLRTVPKGLAKSSTGDAILAAVRAGEETPRDALPKIEYEEPPLKGIGPLTDLLKVLLKYKSEQFDVSGKLIATSADLQKIAADDHAKVHALTGWRREIFGADAIALKHGQIALSIRDGDIHLHKL